MADQLIPLGTEGIRQFRLLRSAAVKTVAEQIYVAHGGAYDRFGPRGREACHEDLAFHLEFLQPVLEFGLLQPMVEYLRWLNSILYARGVPANHLALSLDLLATFFAQNMDAADAVAVATALHAARERFLEVEDAPPPAEGPEPWAEVEQFESALLAGSQPRALAVVNSCLDSGRDLVEVDLHIIKPALYHIGERWQANQVSVAAEHLATAIAQSVMTAGLLRSPPLPMIGKRVLLTCVAGNEHALGARMVADAFQLCGWDVHYLGANVPTSAIIRHAVECKADLVGLSVSFPQQLPVVKEIIVRLGEQLGGVRPAVIIGGIAINRFSRLVDMVGADAFGADPPAALAYARQFLTTGSPDPWFAPELEPLLAVAAAALDEDGTLLEANAGFTHLIKTWEPNPIGTDVSRFFIQPEFSTFVGGHTGGTDQIHCGLITIGSFFDRSRSLRGRVWRAGGKLRVLAEYDVEELGWLNDTVLALNQDYANAQFALTQLNLKLQQREAQILASSLTDPLTGVGNRRRLDQALAAEVGRAERSGGKLCAFMADLDHFKHVNDAFGHEAGDAVLAGFGDKLRRLTRSTDIVTRFGGEEFVVLMPDTELENAAPVAERIREAIAARRFDPLPHPVTASFGLVELTPGEQGSALLRRADTALYQAKSAGRNQVVRG